jgi:hypothetical protein
MPISRTNCLSAASFCPAGIHLFGAGNPAQPGKTAGDATSLGADPLDEQGLGRLAGRDPPVLTETGNTHNG